jgi:polyphenol oxidase
MDHREPAGMSGLSGAAGNVLRERDGLTWFEPVEPLGGIAHVVMTTRGGGSSREGYQSLNLAMHVGDVEERVRQNRRRMLRALPRRGLLDPVVGEQVHGAGVQAVGELHAGTRWQQSEHALARTDALATATRRLPLVILVADCLPLALVDPTRQAAAVVHAGWRGVEAGVVEGTLHLMKRVWGTMAADVVAWQGPGIGPCCFEVGPEVAERFSGACLPGEGDRSYLDLRSAVGSRLQQAGVLEENLTGLPVCTACRADLFFSYRRERRSGGKETGRQALILWLERSSVNGQQPAVSGQ